MPERTSSSKSEPEVLLSVTKQLQQLEEKVDKMEDGQQNILTLIKLSTPREVKKAIEDSTKKQNQNLIVELNKLKNQVKRLIDEIKFDPDNPTPTEISTEENYKQILAPSEQVVPLISSELPDNSRASHSNPERSHQTTLIIEEVVKAAAKRLAKSQS